MWSRLHARYKNLLGHTSHPTTGIVRSRRDLAIPPPNSFLGEVSGQPPLPFATTGNRRATPPPIARGTSLTTISRRFFRGSARTWLAQILLSSSDGARSTCPTTHARIRSNTPQDRWRVLLAKSLYIYVFIYLIFFSYVVLIFGRVPCFVLCRGCRFAMWSDGC